MKNKKGFTLVELVIVIVIVGILSIVSVPIYKGYVKRAYAAEGWALLGMISTAQKIYYSDYGYFGGQAEIEKEINASSNKYFTSFIMEGGGTQAWTAIVNGIEEANDLSLTMIGSSTSSVRTFGTGSPDGSGGSGSGSGSDSVSQSSSGGFLPSFTNEQITGINAALYAGGYSIENIISQYSSAYPWLEQNRDFIINRVFNDGLYQYEHFNYQNDGLEGAVFSYEGLLAIENRMNNGNLYNPKYSASDNGFAAQVLHDLGIDF